MKSHSILLTGQAAIFLLLFTTAYCTEIVLYDIDFSSPEYQINKPVPFFNSGRAPRIYPDYDSFGQQVVRAAYGELTDQPAEFVPSPTGVTYRNLD